MTDIIQIEHILKTLKEESAASDIFRKNARIRILNTVTPVPWYHRPRLLGYTVGSALATVLISAGTVYAAQSSLPDTPLYPVKVISENVALTLSPTASIKTSVAQTIISRRVTEVAEIKKQGNAPAIEKSIRHLNEDVQSLQTKKDIKKEDIEKIISPESKQKDEHPQVEGASENRRGED